MSSQQSTDRPKRLANKPHRYKTTSSEDKIKKKKPKPLDEAKIKKKVFHNIQNISDKLKLHNTCASTYNVNGNATITKPRIIENRIYSSKYALQTTHNQEQNKLSYIPIPLDGQKSFNQDIYNAQNMQNCENMPPKNVTIDNLCHIQKENIQQLLDPYENSLERIFINEASKTASETQLTHTTMENPKPHNEMYTFNNDQLPPHTDSNNIQELVTISSSVIPQPIEPSRIQLSNTTTPAIGQNIQLCDLLNEIKGEIQSINERLNTIEHKIELNVLNEMPTKPLLLPFSTIEAVEMFQKDTAVYQDVVHYFKFLNCVTLKDSVHQCIKEALTIELADKFTWWGKNERKFPFYSTILSQAIYQAVATNRCYPKPTREEFQREVVGSLKIAKQRIINARGRHPGLPGNQRNLEEAANAIYNEDANHDLQANRLLQNSNNNNREMESSSDDSDNSSLSNLDKE